MNRFLGFLWIYFKLVILPFSILASFTHQEPRTLIEVYGGFVDGINSMMIGVINDKYWDFIQAITTVFTYPMALLTWIMPSFVKYPFLLGAALAGEAGIFVLLWAFCWWLPLPRFLRSGPGKVRQEAA